jgi:8-oxo-dGTP pyrophosphatase MutT (NUDIX family)
MPLYDEKSCGAAIFKREADQILYLTVEYKKEPGYWGLTKGHVEPGESELETARREIYEEVGLSALTFLDGFRAEISYQPKPGVTKLVVFFLAEARDDRVEYHFAEHIDHLWLPYREVIAKLTYPADRGVITQAAQFLRDPNHK